MTKKMSRELLIATLLLNTSVAHSGQGWLCIIYVIARKMTSGWGMEEKLYCWETLAPGGLDTGWQREQCRAEAQSWLQQYPRPVNTDGHCTSDQKAEVSVVETPARVPGMSCHPSQIPKRAGDGSISSFSPQLQAEPSAHFITVWKDGEPLSLTSEHAQSTPSGSYVFSPQLSEATFYRWLWGLGISSCPQCPLPCYH